jgi:hypothetical protein
MTNLYTIHFVSDADMTEYESDEIARTFDLSEAKRIADDRSSDGAFGTVIVYHTEGIVDWGHGTSKIGEPAPKVGI